MDVNALKLKLATGAQIQIKDHCPNTAVDYPEQAHSRYFTVFAVYITMAQSCAIMLACGRYVSLAHFSTSHL